jgi:hypothetical protein
LAFFPGPVIDGKTLLEDALAAIGRGKIAQGGATRRNGFVQHIPDMADKIIEAGIIDVFSNQSSRFAAGGKAAAIQNLTHINVAKARNNPLIQQGGFQGCGFFPELACQKISAEFIAKRLDANVL